MQEPWHWKYPITLWNFPVNLRPTSYLISIQSKIFEIISSIQLLTESTNQYLNITKYKTAGAVVVSTIPSFKSERLEQ